MLDVSTGFDRAVDKGLRTRDPPGRSSTNNVGLGSESWVLGSDWLTVSSSLLSLVTAEDPRPLIGCHWPRPMASIKAAVSDHCATVVSAPVLAPKMLQISNPRPEWF